MGCEYVDQELSLLNVGGDHCVVVRDKCGQNSAGMLPRINKILGPIGGIMFVDLEYLFFW